MSIDGPASETAPPAVVAPVPLAFDTGVARSSGVATRLRGLVEPRLPWLVGLWFAGVGLCSLRPVCGLVGEWRLRRYELSPVPETIAQMLVQVAASMRVSRPVRIAESALVRVPLVIGYLRPLILLPVGVVVGLTPANSRAASRTSWRMCGGTTGSSTRSRFWPRRSSSTIRPCGGSRAGAVHARALLR